MLKSRIIVKEAEREAATISPARACWHFWKWCSSHMWRGPILVFLGPSVLDLGPMYAIDRQRRQTRIIAYW